VLYRQCYTGGGAGGPGDRVGGHHALLYTDNKLYRLLSL